MESEAKTLQEHLAEFKEQGFTIFPKVFDEATMQRWREKFYEMGAEGIEGLPQITWWYPDMVERAPTLMLPAVANPVLLDFAELVLGPFVQLDNLTLAGIPSTAPEKVTNPATGWHRDRWGQVPTSTDYQHPLAINALSYLTDLSPEFGPLRLIPGSHRQPYLIEPEEQGQARPDELILNVKAGDVAVIHNGVVHSGSPNVSGQTRFLFSIYYNKIWLKHTDNHNGPNVQALIKKARDNNDLRTLRLFGVDDNLEQRANSQFIRPDEEKWSQWAEQDKAALKTPS